MAKASERAPVLGPAFIRLLARFGDADLPRTPPVLTERLVLRTAEPGDLQAMHRVLSEPRAMTWWSSLPHETLEETQSWVAGMVDA